MDDKFHLYALCLTIIASIYAWYFTRKRGKWYKNLPPSPPTLPIIGNFHQVGGLPHQSLWELSKKYGKIMLVHLASRPMVVVSSADVAKEFLKTHDITFASKPATIGAKKLFYDMKDVIHLPYGDEWRKLKSIFVHDLLGSQRVRSYSSIREEETALLVERIKQSCLSSSPVNMTDTFMSLMNDLISRAAFGMKHSETENGKKFLEDMAEGVELLVKFSVDEYIPWLAWTNRGYSAALEKVSAKVDGFLVSVIDEHLDRARKTSNGVGPDQGESGENFLDILLGIYQGKTPGLSIDMMSVKAVLLDVFGAGTETSATTLGWIMTELIRHPAVMKKLQDEVREIMNGKQVIADDDLEKMHYMKAVIKEGFRCHPPVTLYFHEAREYVNLMGYDIPPGTMITFNTRAIGRDPACWDEPEKFMPERFLNSTIDFRGFDFQLIPFGAGRRICPGVGFATLALEHTLANLMHKFDWALPDGARGEDLDVTEKWGVTVGRKNPLILVPTKCYC